jgi:hypothetical protein
MSAREAGIGVVSLIVGGVIAGLTWAAICAKKEDTVDKTADDATVAGTQNADGFFTNRPDRLLGYYQRACPSPSETLRKLGYD